ncbi:MAG: type II toxin-antitoxin system VapC family toxin [Coriobacteriia bacterium]
MKYRYWDASCFIAWLNAEQGRMEKCDGVVQAASKGELKIVTSAITLTEVIKPNSETVMGPEKDTTINSFFQRPEIIVRDVDRNTAEFARGLIWTYPHLRRNDAIHVATAALTEEAEVLDSFDGHMLRLDGQIGNPGLRITRPGIPFRSELPEDINEE